MSAFALLAVVTYGALAFGAVYPWAYASLTLAATLLAAWLLVTTRPIVLNKPLLIALSLVIVAISVQLLPLPEASLTLLSPKLHEFRSKHDLQYAVALLADRDGPAGGQWRPLTIAPRETLVGLGLLVAFSALFLAVQSTFSSARAERFVRGMSGLGALVAVISVLQWASHSEKVYGLWQPVMSKTPAAPFINRNHLAGWLLMVIPLSLGYLTTVLWRMSEGNRDWRARVVALSTREGSHVFRVAFCCVLMLVALVLSGSRSGMLALAATAPLLIFGLLRGGSARGRWSAAVLAAILITAVVWAGVDPVIERFADIQESSQLRQSIWRDSWNVAADFPLTGTGLNTLGTAMLVYQTPGQTYHIKEAHSDYLQLLAEGGLWLAVPIVLAAVTLILQVLKSLRQSAGNDRALRLGAACGLLAIALQEMVEFSLQIPGNAVLFAALAAIAVRKPSDPDRRLPRPASLEEH